MALDRDLDMAQAKLVERLRGLSTDELSAIVDQAIDTVHEFLRAMEKMQALAETLVPLDLASAPAGAFDARMDEARRLLRVLEGVRRVQ